MTQSIANTMNMIQDIVEQTGSNISSNQDGTSMDKLTDFSSIIDNAMSDRMLGDQVLNDILDEPSITNDDINNSNILYSVMNINDNTNTNTNTLYSTIITKDIQDSVPNMINQAITNTDNDTRTIYENSNQMMLDAVVEEYNEASVDVINQMLDKELSDVDESKVVQQDTLASTDIYLNALDILKQGRELVQDNLNCNIAEVDVNSLNIEINNNQENLLTDLSSKVQTNVTNKNSYNIDDLNEPHNVKDIEGDMLKELNIEKITVDAENSQENNGENMLQNQTPQESAIKVMMNVDNSNDFELNLTEDKLTSNEPSEIPQSKIIGQITKQLNGITSSSKINIVMNPERLGKVDVLVTKSQEGVTAEFVVSSAETKDILMKNIDSLKESLISQGVDVNNVSVKLNETQNSEYKQDWTEQEHQNNGNKEQGQQKKRDNQDKQFERELANLGEEEQS